MPTVTSQGNLLVDNTVIADLAVSQQQETERRRPRLYLDRVPLESADDEEITAIWTANRIAADIIAPNQAARTVAAGQLQLNVTEIPNIKMGAHLNQQDVNRLKRLMDQQALGRAGADEYFMFWDDIVRERREAIYDRLNWMAAGMLQGALSYDRLGVQISVNFLMPSDVRRAVTTPWSTASTATPITDIFDLAAYTVFTHGFRPNRVTLTRTDFVNMIRTTQVRELAQAIVGVAATAAVNTSNQPLMQNYVGVLLGGMAIEIDDHVYRTEESDGSVTSHVDLPAGTVLLTNSQDDGNRRLFDIANAPVTEAEVARLTGDTKFNLGGQERGPAVFATHPEDLNPPQITVWGVARAFPRRKVPVCSAVLLGV